MGGAVVAAALSVGVGLLIAVQAPINASLAKALGSPVPATLVTFGVSSLGVLAVFTATTGPFDWKAPAPWLFAAGGLIGIPIVAGALILVPKLGAGTYLVAVIAGQLAAGLLLDHLGAFGLDTHPISLGRIAGMLVVIGGALLIRAF